MNHLLDAIALLIVAACTLYALRTLLPQPLLARLTGKPQPRKTSCGGCNGCGKKER